MSWDWDPIGSNALFSWFSEDGYQEPSKYTTPWNRVDPLSQGALPYQLVVDGCQPDPSLPTNCTTACQNISWLATSPYAIYACHTASSIATRLPSFSEHSNIISDAYSVGIDFNTPGMLSWIEPLANCLITYCNSSTNACSSGGHDCLILSEEFRSNSTGSMETLQDCIVKDVCSNAETKGNKYSRSIHDAQSTDTWCKLIAILVVSEYYIPLAYYIVG